MEKVTLRAFTDGDIDLMSRWLSASHVLKWYTEPESWLHEIRNRNGEFSFLRHFVTLYDGEPIGFCQCYDCFDAGEDWYSVKEKGKLYSIDYLIGDVKYLGKGLGKATILALEAEISKNKDAEAIIVQPDSENAASCNTLLSCGYIFERGRNYYLKSLSSR